jgi:hypothetical protein
MSWQQENLIGCVGACAGLQDDAPLPADRYSHMSDTLLPDRDPQTFEAWKAEMETKLQQRLQQPRPSAHTALAQDS